MEKGALAVTARRYEIRVGGTLDPHWWGWFKGYAIRTDTNETVLTGEIVDQRRLLGTLVTLHELGHDLVAVRAAASARPGEANSDGVMIWQGAFSRCD